LVAALTFLSAAVPSAATDYEIVTFKVPTAPITGGRGLNDAGCVAGYYQTDVVDFSTAHALRLCGGVIDTVNPPTSLADRRAFDVNDAGTLVGSALRTMGQAGFELAGGTYTWVEYPAAELTVIRGINNLGDVVGEYELADGVRHAFARVAGLFSNVDVPGAASSRARGINDVGEIVGHYDDAGGLRHGFFRSAAGATTTIDYPGAVQSLVGGINNARDMVGTYFDGGGMPHGFLSSAGVFDAFDVPGAFGTIATGINETGQITGEFTDNLGIRRGFVATPYLFTDGFESGDTSAWSVP
jgi:hypothetical protein